MILRRVYVVKRRYLIAHWGTLQNTFCFINSSHSRLFNSYEDFIFVSERLQMLSYSRISSPLSSEVFFMVPNLMWHGTSVYLPIKKGLCPLVLSRWLSIYSFPKLLLNTTETGLPEKIPIGGHLIRILLVLCHYTIGHMSKQVFKDKNFFPAENIQTFYSCIPSSKLLHRIFPSHVSFLESNRSENWSDSNY